MKNTTKALFFAIALMGGSACVYSAGAGAEEGIGAIVEDRMSPDEHMTGTRTETKQPAPATQATTQSDRPMWLTEEEDALKPAAPPIPDTPAAKMDYLQQQLQNLQGKLELQDHRIQELSKQLTDHYQDLDMRLKNLSALQASQSAQAPINAPKATEASTPAATTPEATATQPAVALIPASVPTPAVSAEDDKAVYQQAYSLAQEKKYDQSIEVFKRLIQTHPKSTYVPTAYFWMGEIYVIQSKYDAAVESFNQIVSHYPSSPKVSEALFKTGYIAYAQGNNKLAAKKFTEVKTRYPGTSASKQADQYLKKLKAKKA